MTVIQRQRHTIDATGQPLGRLASKIAHILMGKNKADYMPNADRGDFVEVINFSKAGYSGKKLDQKGYFRHSGYVGSLKEFKLKDVLVKSPKRVLELAVKRMLPDNKLRAPRMKRLTIGL